MTINGLLDGVDMLAAGRSIAGKTQNLGAIDRVKADTQSTRVISSPTHRLPLSIEESPGKVRCVPFSQIPDISRLFLDFLEGLPAVSGFYSRSPKFSEWFKDESLRIRYDSARRERMADLLERQNAAWGTAAATTQNIERLRKGACAVVTGQQVALFGGPIFFLYKALSAVRLAEEATRGGVDCVPVFWLATQDHDLGEVNQVSIPGSDSRLNKISVVPQAKIGTPVSNVELGPDVEVSLNRAAELLGDSEGIAMLRKAYSPGETFGSAFAKLFAQLFGEWGLILLDASDPDLNAIAAPVYAEALERAESLEEGLLARSKQLETAGYHRQVKVVPSSTLLFCLKEGARTPVHRSAPDSFRIGEERVGKRELLERVKAKPYEFSPNVLLRPVVQDYLLPSLAYTGGFSETAYFAQASVVYQAIAGRVTPIVPQFSATVLEPKSQALLQKYGIHLTDVIRGPEALRECLGAQHIPQALQSAFDKAGADVSKSMAEVTELISKLDKSLVEASINTVSKIAYQIDNLRSRVGKAELCQSEILTRHAAILSNLLFPGRNLQDRKISSIYFIARYGKQFLRDVHRAIRVDHADQQLQLMLLRILR